MASAWGTSPFSERSKKSSRDFGSIRQPEQLKGDLSKYWSRRLNKKDRIQASLQCLGFYL
ncbi:MAG: type II toxin-antitoxin system YoeB family toxin [Chlorobaculum sp.]|nr:type II toxin-antitoxin system YoeB family toxin [Chlorobaculum sp.]